MNKAVLVGRLTTDPILKFSQGKGTAIVTFTLAVNRKFKREGQPDADFIPIVLFGKTAEATANYSAKGKLVSVSGSIQNENYEAKDGIRRYVTKILGEEIDFLEWASKGKTENKDTSEDLTPIDSGDIPF